MAEEINLKIILTSPPRGVDFSLQKGKGNNYETIDKQRSSKDDISFEFKIALRSLQKDTPDFGGPFVHGTSEERFIYIDIGVCAGQLDSLWSRRLKVPLRGITSAMIKRLVTHPTSVLQTIVPGTAKAGGPNCATVKPFPGWHIVL